MSRAGAVGERHASNLTVALIIGYVGDRGGEAAVERLLEIAGETRPMAELLDEGRWSSYEQKIRLFEAAIEVLGDPEAPRRIGAGILEQQTGTAIRLLLRALGSPASVCRSVARASAKFATNYTFQAVAVGRSGAVISNRLHDGFQPNIVDCLYTIGLLSQIPALFGLEPAEILHEECQVHGAPACIYTLKWRARNRLPWARRRAKVAYLEEELRLLSERHEELHSSILDLVSPADVDTVLDRITRRAAGAVRAQRFLLALRDDAGRVSVHHDGMPDEDALRLASQVLGNEPDEGGGSRMIVDVESSRRFYGRLVALYDLEHGFFPEERRLFASYARQAAVALDAATALEEARRRSETASTLLDLSSQLALATSTVEVAERLADAVPSVIGAHRVSVFAWEPDHGALRVLARVPADDPHRLGKPNDVITVADTPVLGEMVRTREPQHVHRETADPYLKERMTAIGLEEFLSVPIQSGGQMIGAIAAQRDIGAPPLVDRQALADRLKGMADQAALAFEKVRLLEQEREAVRRLQRNEQRIKQLAYHDALTELPNGRHFSEALESCLSRAESEGRMLALLFCDLDRFKNVNDSMGHAKGDELLKVAASRLQGCIRDSDTLARLGGDEFTLLLNGVTGWEDAAMVADRVLAAFGDPINLDGQELFLSASVGVALYPEDGRDAQTLLKNADTAMYGAKNGGRNNRLRYVPEMNSRARQLLELEADLHEALRSGQLVVHYQPQVAAGSGEVVAVEALVRWNHPRRGLVRPGEFIALAEERGLIAAVDSCVLLEAASQCQRWIEAGLPPVRVGVNLSAHQFRGTEVVDMVTRVLGETGAPPDLLELELTETAAMQDPNRVAELMAELRGLGVGLALDDFGTGYSSWTHLKHFPVGRLKIDRSFVSGLPDDRYDAAIATATIDMAHLMGMGVTAEGVETRSQAEFLTSHGCDLLQGFFYSEPKPAEEVTAILRAVAASGAPWVATSMA